MMPRCRCRSYQRGSTLLEVVLAVALMAASGVGLVATQLWLSRQDRATAIRERAAFIADAFAEMAAVADAGSVARDQWTTRASIVIPGSVVSLASSGVDASVVAVTWPAASDGLVPSGTGDRRHCGDAPASAGRECVSLTFARR